MLQVDLSSLLSEREKASEASFNEVAQRPSEPGKKIKLLLESLNPGLPGLLLGLFHVKQVHWGSYG